MNTATNPRTGTGRNLPGSRDTGGRDRGTRRPAGAPAVPAAAGDDGCRRRTGAGRCPLGPALPAAETLDGLVGAAKSPSPPDPARRRRAPPPGHGHHRLPRPARPASDDSDAERRAPATRAPAGTGPGHFRPGARTRQHRDLLFTGPVTASTVRKIACDADIIPVLLGGEGRVLDIGRASRVFPPHIRKALTARDQGCAFPGCTIPAPWCEAHHITYWSHGGTTGTDNGTLLCSHHHHLIHKEHWTIQIKTGIPWFIPPPHIDPRQHPRRNHYFHPEDLTTAA